MLAEAGFAAAVGAPSGGAGLDVGALVARYANDLLIAGKVSANQVGVTAAQDLSQGDYVTAVALRTARAADRTPRDFATTLARNLSQAPEFASATVTGPGFVHFRLSAQAWESLLQDVVLHKKARYGVLASPCPVVVDPARGRGSQYVHARITSILRNAEFFPEYRYIAPDFAALSAVWDRQALRAIAEVPRHSTRAGTRETPDRLVRHLTELSETFLTCSAQRTWSVLPRGPELITSAHSARLMLVAAIRQVLRNGLVWLGIPAPERM